MTQVNTFMMVGNPGAGKSTLLNGLLGKVKFLSGISLGNGLTTVLQEEKDEFGNRFIDTPGLNDIDMRVSAAKEIEKALKRGGTSRIFFVSSLDSGRIKPEDKTTMKLVLEAAKDIRSNYSIIVNKVSAPVYQRIFENKREFEQMKTRMTAGLPEITENVFFNRQDPNLDDQDNMLPQLSEELQSFIRNAPSVDVIAQNVQDIKIDQFDRIVDESRKKIQELEKLIQNQELRLNLKAEESKALEKRIDEFEKAQQQRFHLQQKHFDEKEASLKNEIEKLKCQNGVQSNSVQTLPSSEIYERESGVITWLNGQKYEGEIQDDEPHGKGVMTWPDGDRYECEWKNGLPHGKVVRTMRDGRYECVWKDGLPHGTIVFISVRGGRYERDWVLHTANMLKREILGPMARDPRVRENLIRAGFMRRCID
eukprot:CAMPEP_0176434138 /NCGR_PEP_ID=MMETSP0127-20121128/16486_1 /TAXON_ID=938130 /ORGANISM="Platyophrya macrostoma, Strain WH" /LENGTH=422 /DNA_ID=CAMNT_0017816793 /DNA_START=118 /DNA_END=1386 /DNA_ORIENTATION=-